MHAAMAVVPGPMTAAGTAESFLKHNDATCNATLDNEVLHDIASSGYSGNAIHPDTHPEASGPLSATMRANIESDGKYRQQTVFSFIAFFRHASAIHFKRAKRRILI